MSRVYISQWPSRRWRLQPTARNKNFSLPCGEWLDWWHGDVMIRTTYLPGLLWTRYARLFLTRFFQVDNFNLYESQLVSDELGYLVDAIVNEDKISTFDKRPGDMSIEVRRYQLSSCFFAAMHLLWYPSYRPKRLKCIFRMFQDKHLLSRLLLILGGDSFYASQFPLGPFINDVSREGVT